jgi:stearoyl-CoA desaturase (Delta-9 desaturase)
VLSENMEKELRNEPITKSIIEFVAIHTLPLLAFFTGVTSFDWIMCAFLYFFRMFWITGGYHRYFAHKSYQTSRWFQFVIAFMAQTSMQKGALWWAAHHRIHHRTSDTAEDPHSMKIYGFLYSHFGWIMSPDFKVTHYNLIQDYAKFPELRWLNRNHLVPSLTLLFMVFLIGGFVNDTPAVLKGVEIGGWHLGGALSAALIQFVLSTAILYNGTFSINSLMHKIGRPRYKTGDESKNSFFLALLTMGEGWHNNHHYYQVAARNGFFWWEIDCTFYILKVFSWFGLVWDLKGVPAEVMHSESLDEAREKMAQNNN